MGSRFIVSLAAIAFMASSACAFAEADLYGRWRDNAPSGDPMGVLRISPEKIVVGGKVTYQVKPAGAFGDGQLFAVTGMNRKQDPEGCGPGGRVRFVAIQPLPPVAPGIGGPAIRVFFYAGEAAPNPESIVNDVALCSIHPFGR